MSLPSVFQDALSKAEGRSSTPVTFIWPMPGFPGGQLISSSCFSNWQAFVVNLGLRRMVSETVADKFEREQKLLLFAWG